MISFRRATHCLHSIYPLASSLPITTMTSPRIEGLLNEENESLHLRVAGPDRPNVISDVTGQLEKQQLYVDSITFNLVMPSQDQFQMEILARGGIQNLRQVKFIMDSGKFFEGAPASDRYNRPITWATANLLHIALYTPDQEGLTAGISKVVGKERTIVDENVCPYGNFVHLIGSTHNAGGAEGATPFYSLRANVATESLHIQHEIVEDLQTWAREQSIDGDIWTRDLNHSS